MTQQQAAQKALCDTLAKQNGLGQAPFKVEPAGEFSLHGLRYYLFRHKKSPAAGWRFAAYGGFEKDETQARGQAFLLDEARDEAGAREAAVAAVERFREKWSREPSGGVLSGEMLRQIKRYDSGSYLPAILDLIEQGVSQGLYTRAELDNDLEAALWRAYVYINLEDNEMYRRALSVLGRVEAQAQESGVWHYRYSVSLMSLGRYKQALLYAEKGAAAEPGFPWIWLQLARISYYFGKTEQALDAVARGLALVPDNYEFLTTRREIEEKADFFQMIGHYIDPEVDQQENLRERADAARSRYAQLEQERPLIQEPKAKGGPFVSFVLLDEPALDEEKLRADLLDSWGIALPEDSGSAGLPIYVWTQDGMMVTLSLIPAPVPNREAEENAKNNYQWDGACRAAQEHRAHLMAAVLPSGQKPTEAGKLMVKLCAAALGQAHATGLYATGTVFEPDFYIKCAAMLKDGLFPLFNLLYFGLYRKNGKNCAYTYGMEVFGFEELEVLDSSASPQELRTLLFSAAVYVLSNDAALKEGDGLWFDSERPLPITRSPGQAVEGMTIKIKY